MSIITEHQAPAADLGFAEVHRRVRLRDAFRRLRLAKALAAIAEADAQRARSTVDSVRVEISELRVDPCDEAHAA